MSTSLVYICCFVSSIAQQLYNPHYKAYEQQCEMSPGLQFLGKVNKDILEGNSNYTSMFKDIVFNKSKNWYNIAAIII